MTYFIFFISTLIILHLTGLLISIFFIKKYSFAQIDGFNIHYRKVGDGKKETLLIHGMFSNLHCWDKFLEYKDPNRTYILIDLPMMAESYSFNKKIPVDNIEDIIYKFATQVCKYKTPELVGCSLGGLVAFLTKQKYHDVFDECVIVSSPFSETILTLPIYKLSFLTPLLNVFVNPLVVFIGHYQTAKNNFSFRQAFVILSKFRRLSHFGASLKYSRLIVRADQLLKSKTKVQSFYHIWGDRDHLVKEKHFTEFRNLNQNKDLSVIEGGAHHPMESHPKEFAQSLNQLLKD